MCETVGYGGVEPFSNVTSGVWGGDEIVVEVVDDLGVIDNDRRDMGGRSSKVRMRVRILALLLVVGLVPYAVGSG